MNYSGMWSAWVRLDVSRWKLLGNAHTEDGAWLLFGQREEGLERWVWYKGVPPIAVATKG